MNYRRVLAGLAGLTGLVLVVASGVAADLVPVEWAIGLLGNDYHVVAAVGVLAALLAGSVVVSGRAANLDHVRMPTPERPTTAPPPGTEFDDSYRRLVVSLPVVGASQRATVRDRLRETAVATMQRRTTEDREAARRRIEDGTWTDDRAAAAFLAGERPNGPPGRRLRALAAGETWFVHLVRSTVAAIERGESS